MINGAIFKNAIISGANNIANQKNEINDLNIFPVPDGDTGTNMTMTISAAAVAVADMDSENLSEVSAKVASALLRGARGNSGVILSLLFKGFAKGFEGLEQASGADIANALQIGVDAAYKAVMKPTEGTMLTVARMAAEAADVAARRNNDSFDVWNIICNAADEALLLTPQLLPVLKKAGVVDAGGRGVCEIFKGMQSVFNNNKIIELKDASNSTKTPDNDVFASAAAEFDGDINFTYCTEFIIDKLPDCTKTAAELRAYLETIGDCVVVVEDDDIIKVHVHTENPGNALQCGLGCGQLITVKVENMKEQHKNAAASQTKKSSEVIVAEPVEEYGFVSVAAGSGIADLFSELGCGSVVSGGQTMNPSTDDIYAAVMATPAKNVFVLPNNKNIILAAEQTVPMVTDRKVIILPTSTIPQGLSAMLAYDPELSASDNKNAMMEYASGVATGQVTFAARDSEFGTSKIKEGDIIALENGKLTITEKDMVKAVSKLAKNMIKKDTAFITVIYGEGVSEEIAGKAYDAISARAGNDVEVTLVNGGQPVYYFILSVE